MIGETLGSYRVVSRLGSGGMGVVYVAEHQLLGRQAAVKLLRPELSKDPEILQRFFNEARAASQLRHPGIIDVFDFGHHANGSAFLTMELLDGESLATRLAREHRLPAEQVIGIGRQIAAAMGAAHARQIVHRDLKPENIFLSPEADAPDGVRVRVLDFGIAKLRGDIGAPSPETETGIVLGTAYYMSPEQCRGDSGLDHRSDIYSMGCMLFEMACGRRPFVGQSSGEVVAAHLHMPPPPPREAWAGLSPALEAVILRALAKRPAERQASMAQLADELTAAAKGVAPQPLALALASTAPAKAAAAAGVAGVSAPRGRSGRLPWLLAGAGLVVAVAILAAIRLSGRSGGQSSRERALLAAAAPLDAAVPTATTPQAAALVVDAGRDAAPAPAPLTDDELEALFVAVSSCALSDEGIAPTCRELAAWRDAYWREGSARAPALATRHIGHDSPAVRALSAPYLPQGTRVELLLAAAGNEKVPGVLHAIVEAIGAEGGRNPAVGKLLLRLADHPQPGVRKQVVRALSSQDNAKLAGSIEVLIRAAERDPVPELRQWACELAGRRGDDRLVPMFERLTRDPAPNPNLYSSCMSGLVESWVEGIFMQTLSKQGYLLTLERLSDRPRSAQRPSWVAIGRLSHLGDNSDHVDKWLEKATWYEPARLQAVLADIVADRDADRMARSAAIQVLVAVKAPRAVFEPLRQKYEKAAGRGSTDSDIFDKIQAALAGL